MTLMQSILERNLSIWDECAATPFVRGLSDGTLPMDRFRQYIIQDSIYLKHYARVYGKAIFLARSLRDIQLYYSALNFVTDAESAVRLNYLRRFGLTDDDVERIDPLPENARYIDFLFSVARRDNEREILIAVLPCMLSYSYIFRKLSAMPESRLSVYWDFIQSYEDAAYADSCREWLAFADRKCAGLDVAEQNRLAAVFTRASLLELDFWHMLYR